MHQCEKTQNCPFLRSNPFSWGVISLLVIAYFIPYALPGVTFSSLQTYNAVITIPLAVAAYLREYRGSILVWIVTTLGLTIFLLTKESFPPPLSTTASLILGDIVGLLIALVLSYFFRLHRNLSKAKKELEVAHESIQQQALTDAVTGLPNHRAICIHLEQEIERARRFNRPLSLIFFDGDHFKRVNDTHGHAIGDVVLKELGQRVSHVLRAGDVLGRFGGEEFIVLLPETPTSQAVLVAERLRVAVASLPVAIAQVDGGIHATISIGVATYPEDSNNMNGLMEKADAAMYCAKKLGRNQVRTVADANVVSGKNILATLLQKENREQEIPALPLQRIHHLTPIYSLMRLLELRDSAINAHSHAVSDLVSSIAQQMDLDQDTILSFSMAALLHDIGKIAIPDVLLKKEGPLSPREWELIRQHPNFGAQILEASPFMTELAPAIRYHHEHWDGSGYPYGLKGNEIPLGARIIGIAEAYHAMISDRPYKLARTPQDAMLELQRCSGTQFDPIVLKATLAVVEQQLLIEEMVQQREAV